MSGPAASWSGPPIIKIGGSLARTGRATGALAEVVDAARDGALVVSGGGDEVDRVRAAFRRGELEGEEAYWEAARALDRMSARLVAAYQASVGGDDVRLCADLEACRETLREGRIPVVTPYPVIRPVAGFPVAWETTSDSIAAFVAGRTGAALVLVKAREPRSAPRSRDDRAPIFTADALAEEGLVDGNLGRFLAGDDAPASCWIVDGSRPGRLRSWLSGDPSRGARVVADAQPEPSASSSRRSSR